MKRSEHAHRQIRAAVVTLETHALLAHIGLDPSFAAGDSDSSLTDSKDSLTSMEIIL